MDISKEEIEHIAKLAKLRFSGSELNHLKLELSKIVSYVEKLNELELQDVPETAHMHGLANVFRDDVVDAEMGREEALMNAPKTTGGYFSVPKVIE